MARNKTYANQQIEDIEYTGHGITHANGKVFFVEGTLPGEVVDLRVTRRKKSHSFATVTKWHSQSGDRVQPFCSHFDDCGGCTWQYLPYKRQLEYKGRFVSDILSQIAGVTEPAVLPIIGCDADRYYRNKLDFSFAPLRWIPQAEVESGVEVPDRRGFGFHVRGRFDRVLHIDHCYLQPDPSNEIRTAAREIAFDQDLSFHDPRAHEGLLRSLVIRTSETGATMVILVIGEDDVAAAVGFLTRLKESVPAISSAYYIVNETMNDDMFPHPAIRVLGDEALVEQCGHLKFAIHPKSFFQTNTRQAFKLYSIVRDWLQADGSETLLDLYCGIGSIGLFVADKVKEVVGVESIPEAVDRAMENGRLNGITNARFVAGDVRSVLAPVAGMGPSSKAGPSPDIVILDPPRAGLHPDVLKAVIDLAPRQIIYVSCKPSTQARDLVTMLAAYRIERIQPVDMFPQTFHIENVIDLRLR